MATADETFETQELVDSFRRGERQALGRVFTRYHDFVWKKIRKLLPRELCDDDRVGDVEGEVWLSLTRPKRRRLSRFDSQRGSIRTFLDLAAQEGCLVFLRRRLADGPRGEMLMVDFLAWTASARARELVDLRADALDMGLQVEELISGLTPRIRQFLEYHVLHRPGAQPPGPLSKGNEYQLISRLWRAFCAHYGLDPKIWRCRRKRNNG